MVFPVVMYGCESWTTKKAERCGVGEDSLESPLDLQGRSNQTILKEIRPECSLEGLRPKFQYFGHLIQRADSLEKDPDADEDWRQEEKGTTEDETVAWHH